MWHLGHSCFKFASLQKNTQVARMTIIFPWKLSIWQNPNQKRTNQNARIYVKTTCTLPFNNKNYCKIQLLFRFFKSLAVNGVPTSQSVTNAEDCPKLSNHKSKDSKELGEPSSVAVTPDQSSNSQLVPLLPSTTVLSSEEAPTTVCGHLQLLFAQLQYSFRRYVHVQVCSWADSIVLVLINMSCTIACFTRS